MNTVAIGAATNDDATPLMSLAVAIVVIPISSFAPVWRHNKVDDPYQAPLIFVHLSKSLDKRMNVFLILSLS